MAIQDATPAQLASPDPMEQPLEVDILNKKEWHERAETTARECIDSGENLAVLFIDVNYFKEINDTLGHEEGDVVIADIRELVSNVEKSFRVTNNPDYPERPLDIISASEVAPDKKALDVPVGTDATVNDVINATGGHIGGDEFAILARTDHEGAKIIVERLRIMFAEYLGRDDKKALQDIGVGLAIGVGILRRDSIDGGDMLREADEDMYQNKLEQLPNLDEKQRRALAIAKLILEDADIRLRDVPKYWRHLSAIDS